MWHAKEPSLLSLINPYVLSIGLNYQLILTAIKVDNRWIAENLLRWL
jgi:hypothetical protein